MAWSEFLAAQNLMTIGLFLLIAIGLLAFFLRRRSNREAASNAFHGGERSALHRKAERTRAEDARTGSAPSGDPPSAQGGRHPER